MTDSAGHYCGQLVVPVVYGASVNMSSSIAEQTFPLSCVYSSVFFLL